MIENGTNNIQDYTLNKEILFTVSAFKKDLVGVVIAPNRDPNQKTELGADCCAKLPLGGKTLNLMELQRYSNQVGYKVPEGYGVGYDAYMEYIEQINDPQKHEAELPKYLVDLILSMKEELGGAIAIRSSGSVEDGDSASAAGVFESMYIDGNKVKVDNEWVDFQDSYSAIEYVVKRIYNTTRSDGAIDYFQKNGIDESKIKMGLTIQKLVQTPLVAGVMLAKKDTTGSGVNVNYVTQSFGNVIADGTAPGSTLDIFDGNILDHSINPNTNKKPMISNIGHFVISNVANVLSNGILDAYNNSDGDIEFAIDKDEIDQFIEDYEIKHKSELHKIIYHLSNVSNKPEILDFLSCIDEIKQLKAEYSRLKDQINSNNKEKIYLVEIGRNIVLKLRDINIHLEAISKSLNNLESTSINIAIKKSLGNFLMQFFSVLQYRRLVRPFPKYNPNAVGSLNSIYMSGEPVTGVCVCIEDFKRIEDLETTISGYRNQGNKIILVGDAPGIEHERALMMSDAVLLQSSGSGSHIALRAGELGKECIGGLKINKFQTGKTITVDATNMLALNDLSENILEPLFASKDINGEFIKAHIQNVKEFIYKDEPTIDQAVKDLKEKILQECDPENGIILCNILDDNIDSIKQGTIDDYVEIGYDSCQTKRNASKIVSDILLIAGTIYEKSLFGIQLTLEEAKGLYNSNIKIKPEYAENLVNIAKKYGDNQEFLYPGVSPSNNQTNTIEQYIQDTLSGRLTPSVRAMTGVGGLRDDKEYNHTVDFASFLNLKMIEDRRYYPGMVSINLLMEKNADTTPLVLEMKNKNISLYNGIMSIRKVLLDQEKSSIDNASLLCSALLPKNIPDEIYKYSIPKNTDLTYLRLLQAFHSPRSELAALQKMIQDYANGEDIEESEIKSVVDPLITQAKWKKTFNSTLHIPWASGLAKLANGMIGNIKTKEGVSVTRYGIGFENKSFEIQQYDFQDGKTTYLGKIYNNKLFEGEPIKEFYLDEEFRKNLEINGFLNQAVEVLN